MSYETIKSFSASEKNLTIKGSYSSSNVTDMYNRRITEKFEKKYEDIEDFKNSLFTWVDSYFEGTAQFSNSSVFVKRVRMLLHEDLIASHPDKQFPDIIWRTVNRTDLAYQIMIGKEKIYLPTYSIMGDGYAIRKNRSRIQVIDLEDKKPTIFYDIAEAKRIFELTQNSFGWQRFGFRVVEN
ncbi:hypothetical protein [Liquorilactobacillus hordei]|uniref:Uncharacterized protein n=1 Tax=Liquorilactobacillus hordei DSM 19519 TaxID=1423759 RepID=A0A0R1MJC6_9LACO|nr:hypothetical protein [Liquorilactobacillus hordei]KRL08044.1 hypothetical protein FC92_GL001118 [Liquorilactobacillus hordei DSM 19519]QYH51012.1 hypothetical protein G6O70_00155 [Liquorilactobacillus hordei DSM 19519]